MTTENKDITNEYLTCSSVDVIATQWLRKGFDFIYYGAYAIEAYNNKTKQVFCYCEGDISEKTYSNNAEYIKARNMLTIWVSENR